jgi:hypothetical protein
LFIKVIGIARAWEVRVGEAQKTDIVVMTGTMSASHIRKIEDDFVCDSVCTIRGSKDEKRSVIIRHK